MKYRVLVAQRAIDDVIRNANWWAAKYSREKAAEWQQAIFERIYSLDVMPEANPLAFENSDFRYGLRVAHFGPDPDRAIESCLLLSMTPSMCSR